jgi:hypothetical protein
LAKLGAAGLTPIDTSIAGVTVKVVDADTLPRVALMLAVPGEMAVVIPLEPDALPTEATAGAEEVQATRLVRSCTELSV